MLQGRSLELAIYVLDIVMKDRSFIRFKPNSNLMIFDLVKVADSYARQMK
jgi:hypothetical protein